jgi:sulfoxide reductase heme-binding subunit YedZ
LASLSRRLQSPWLDRRGRFSPLKAMTLALALVPALWFLYLTAADELTPLPFVFLIYNTGVWALWMLLASLAVTPARHIFGLGELIAVRRMLGVSGLAYTLLHLYVYVRLDRNDVAYMANEIVTRPTLWVAIISTIGLIILGATSLDSAIQRLGSDTWNRLHYLAYPAVGTAVLHFDMSPGSFGGPPFLMTSIFFWLMAWRVLNRYGRGTDPAALAVLGAVTTAFGFAFEVLWLKLYQGIAAAKTIGFAFDLAGGLAPTWQILIITMSVAALAQLFGRGYPAILRPTAARSLQPT